jgi:hypothetical protein
MSTTQLADNFKRSVKQRDERLFMAIFILSFPVFLVLVLATRLSPAASEVKKERSILSEASASARSVIAVALQD